jgi:tryptophanase
MQDSASREKAIASVGNNVGLLPHEACVFDALTDSKLELYRDANYDDRGGNAINRSDVENLVAQAFGFPYVILVSQGRLAEAIFAKVVARKACIIPNHGLFPTTKAHFNFNGASTPEYIDPESFINDSSLIDLGSLEELFSKRSAFWIPCVALEGANNALHGNLLPFDHLKEVSSLVRKAGSCVYLDGCRLTSNVLMESGGDMSPSDVWNKIRISCEYVDHLTMSLSKDFPIGIGAVFCTRSPEVYYQAKDIALALGSGLSLSDLFAIRRVFSEREITIEHAQSRLEQVRLLGDTVRGGASGKKISVGAHGLFVEADAFSVKSEETLLETCLYHLYVKYGIRASINPISSTQYASGSRVIRIAIPSGIYSDTAIVELGTNLASELSDSTCDYALKKIGQDPGFSGAFSASYEVVSI